MSRAKRKRRSKRARAQYAKRRLPRLIAENPHCYWCGVRVTEAANADGSLPPTHATADHWWPRPLLKGMSREDRRRFVLACHACNNSRGDTPPSEWATLHGTPECAP